MPRCTRGFYRSTSVKVDSFPGRRRVRGLAEGLSSLTGATNPTTQTASRAELRFARTQRRREVEVRTKHHVAHLWVSSHTPEPVRGQVPGVAVGFLSGNDGKLVAVGKRHRQTTSLQVRNSLPRGVETRSQRLHIQRPQNESATRETASQAQSTWPIERDGIVRVSGSPAKTWPVNTHR